MNVQTYLFIGKGERSLSTGLEANGIRQFKALLKPAQRILISTHQLPDGDGLGAEVALYHYLSSNTEGNKKICKVMNPDPLPNRYRFLDPHGALAHRTRLSWKQFDLWIIVDTNDPRRLGSLWKKFSPRAKKIIFLDHHVPIGPGTQDPAAHYPPHAILISDTQSSSIGELLYQIFNQINKKMKTAPLHSHIAIGLYVSVMTDTNSFRYARTTPFSHRIAAEMIENGVNPEAVYQAIYSSKEVIHLKLLGYLLQKLQLSPTGKVAWLELPLKLRKQFKISADDTQSFLYLLLQIKQAEIICFFREEDNHNIRVSMKSKGRVTIHQLAMELGGGGHAYAAGMNLKLPMRKAVSLVIKRLDTAFHLADTR